MRTLKYGENDDVSKNVLATAIALKKNFFFFKLHFKMYCCALLRVKIIRIGFRSIRSGKKMALIKSHY